MEILDRCRQRHRLVTYSERQPSGLYCSKGRVTDMAVQEAFKAITFSQKTQHPAPQTQPLTPETKPTNHYASSVKLQCEHSLWAWPGLPLSPFSEGSTVFSSVKAAELWRTKALPCLCRNPDFPSLFLSVFIIVITPKFTFHFAEATKFTVPQQCSHWHTAG